FFSTHPPPSHTYSLSLHDALPISINVFPVPDGPTSRIPFGIFAPSFVNTPGFFRKSTTSITSVFASSYPATSLNVKTLLFPLSRSEEHTSELQSRFDLVCRLLLEK